MCIFFFQAEDGIRDRGQSPGGGEGLRRQAEVRSAGRVFEERARGPAQGEDGPDAGTRAGTSAGGLAGQGGRNQESEGTAHLQGGRIATARGRPHVSRESPPGGAPQDGGSESPRRLGRGTGSQVAPRGTEEYDHGKGRGGPEEGAVPPAEDGRTPVAGARPHYGGYRGPGQRPPGRG